MNNTMVKNTLYFIAGFSINIVVCLILVTNIFGFSQNDLILITHSYSIVLFIGLIWYGWFNGNEEDLTLNNFLGIFVVVGFTALIQLQTFYFSFPYRLYWIDLFFWVVIATIVLPKKYSTPFKKLTETVFAVPYINR